MVCLLAGMLVPSLSVARRSAERSACAARLRSVGAGLAQFAAAHGEHLPPFAFSDHKGNLPLSGHWGGQSQPADPDCFARRGVADVNLGRLVADGLVRPAELVCPAADASLADGQAGYFPHTSKFSTYCLRMPHSPDVFRMAPELADWNGRGLLAIYTAAGGGETIPVGMAAATVPEVRIDLPLAETNPADGLTRTVCLMDSAIAADTFWLARVDRPAPERPGLTGYRVRARFCHGRKFNVLYGNGSVWCVDDDGSIAAQAATSELTPTDDNARYASYAITAWRYFEDKR